jgi:sortase A
MSPGKIIGRTVEALLWVSGIVLIATYVGLRAWSAQDSDKGMDAMRQARELAAAASPDAPVSATSNRLSVAQPDTSTWSPKRLAEYRNTLTNPDLPDAVLRIPKLKLEVPVYDGTSDRTLNRGAGRIAGTAHVGAVGNIGIAAHRDGYFRPLKDIAVGDAMFLDTVHDTREYRVTRLDIVNPDNVSVLDPTSHPTITLVTCYPFYFVGSAPKRFIVTAQAATSGFTGQLAYGR